MIPQNKKELSSGLSRRQFAKTAGAFGMCAPHLQGFSRSKKESSYFFLQDESRNICVASHRSPLDHRIVIAENQYFQGVFLNRRQDTPLFLDHYFPESFPYVVFLSQNEREDVVYHVAYISGSETGSNFELAGAAQIKISHAPEGNRLLIAQPLWSGCAFFFCNDVTQTMHIIHFSSDLTQQKIYHINDFLFSPFHTLSTFPSHVLGSEADYFLISDANAKIHFLAKLHPDEEDVSLKFELIPLLSHGDELSEDWKFQFQSFSPFLESKDDAGDAFLGAFAAGGVSQTPVFLLKKKSGHFAAVQLSHTDENGIFLQFLSQTKEQFVENFDSEQSSPDCENLNYVYGTLQDTSENPFLFCKNWESGNVFFLSLVQTGKQIFYWEKIPIHWENIDEDDFQIWENFIQNRYQEGDQVSLKNEWEGSRSLKASTQRSRIPVQLQICRGTNVGYELETNCFFLQYDASFNSYVATNQRRYKKNSPIQRHVPRLQALSQEATVPIAVLGSLLAIGLSAYFGWKIWKKYNVVYEIYPALDLEMEFVTTCMHTPPTLSGTGGPTFSPSLGGGIPPSPPKNPDGKGFHRMIPHLQSRISERYEAFCSSLTNITKMSALLEKIIVCGPREWGLSENPRILTGAIQSCLEGGPDSVRFEVNPAGYYVAWADWSRTSIEIFNQWFFKHHQLFFGGRSPYQALMQEKSIFMTKNLDLRLLILSALTYEYSREFFFPLFLAHSKITGATGIFLDVIGRVQDDILARLRWMSPDHTYLSSYEELKLREVVKPKLLEYYFPFVPMI